MCKVIGLKFAPSLDDFSGKPPTKDFLYHLDAAYHEMLTNPPPIARKLLVALRSFAEG